jgi:hypothetical protein
MNLIKEWLCGLYKLLIGIRIVPSSLFYLIQYLLGVNDLDPHTQAVRYVRDNYP